MSENHAQMWKTAVNEAGEELYQCINCDRQVWVTWTPEFKKRVVKQGDINAGHVMFNIPGMSFSMSMDVRPAKSFDIEDTQPIRIKKNRS